MEREGGREGRRDTDRVEDGEGGRERGIQIEERMEREGGKEGYR